MLARFVPIMLLKLPIMLWSNVNAPEFSLLCSNYVPLCSTNSTFSFPYHSYLNYLIMSINSLSSSSTVLIIYLRTHINTLNSLLLHFATLVNTYLTKPLPHINLNLTILGKTCILHTFPLCWQFLPIMLAIFAYYAGIMLNAFTTLLRSKLCWHNRLKPNSSSAI